MLRDFSPDLLTELAGRLRDDTLRPVEARYLEEPRGRHHGRAAAVAAPRTPAEVAEILRFAGEAHVAIVPYGGGTGLVAGQIAEGGPLPLLLSMERMRAIRTVHAEEAVIVAEAGAPVAAVQEAAREAGLLFPLSYGSEGTAQIGAALAVNSGGTGVLRYGNARELCLGLEAVLPDGSIHHGLRRLRKDNTGYDLRGLLIGSEGTLGVITAAALRLFPRPERQAAALLSVASPEAAQTVLNHARDRVGEGVSAFELLSGVGLRFLSETGMAVRWPLADVPDWAVLIDLGTGAGSDPGAMLESLFEVALDEGLVFDGVLSQTESQRDGFWALREAIPEANRKIGAVASHDISLPLGEIARFVAETTPAIEAMGPLRVNTFGHLGDGNLHFNVFPTPGHRREDFEALRPAITETVHAGAMALGGSFSAEHGIGRLKVGDLERWGDPAKLAAMRAIKDALDPRGIMNPGAVLRAR
jgi:FAD/FMN-containing dehydrogenase